MTHETDPSAVSGVNAKIDGKPARLVEGRAPMTPEPTSVMDDLDELIAIAEEGGAGFEPDFARSIRTRVAALVEAASEIHRLMLVIESHVRHAGTTGEHATVLAALKTNAAALLPFKGEK